MTGARFHQPLTFGAELQADGTVRFRFWAPAASAAPTLVLDGGGEVALAAAGGGWFEVRVPARPGTHYRYRLADGLMVPDPAARSQAADVHGWSEVIDPAAYAWRVADWTGRPWREVVLYELHVGAFAGDFDGVAAELDRLRELGVTAIELMPVADFPGGRNWGYDGVLPYAPDRAYGDVTGLKRLVDAAHARGLMVFLDVVYNHFGPDGNYLHLYAPSFFAADVQTPWGPAIDFTQPNVRTFFIENALYWLQEFQFDGLRFDAVHAIDAVPGGESFVAELAERVRAALPPARHVHLVLEHDDNAARHLGPARYDAQWNDDLHHALHVLLTGEADGYYRDYAPAPAAMLARCLGQGFAYQGEASLHRDGAARGESSAHLSPACFVGFLQNHDQVGNRALGERLQMLARPAALEAAIALLLLAPQIPLIFMGEEVASAQPFLYFTDHHGELARAVRDGRRREFARFAAFRTEAAQAAIPDPNDAATFARGRLRLADAGATGEARRRLYRDLLTRRHAEIVPALDGTIALGADAIGPAAVRAAWRLGDGRIVQVLCNLGNEAVQIPSLADTRTIATIPVGVDDDAAIGLLAGCATVWRVLPP